MSTRPTYKPNLFLIVFWYSQFWTTISFDLTSKIYPWASFHHKLNSTSQYSHTKSLIFLMSKVQGSTLFQSPPLQYNRLFQSNRSHEFGTSEYPNFIYWIGRCWWKAFGWCFAKQDGIQYCQDTMFYECACFWTIVWDRDQFCRSSQLPPRFMLQLTLLQDDILTEEC